MNCVLTGGFSLGFLSQPILPARAKLLVRAVLASWAGQASQGCGNRGDPNTGKRGHLAAKPGGLLGLFTECGSLGKWRNTWRKQGKSMDPASPHPVRPRILSAPRTLRGPQRRGQRKIKAYNSQSSKSNVFHAHPHLPQGRESSVLYPPAARVGGSVCCRPQRPGHGQSLGAHSREPLLARRSDAALGHSRAGSMPSPCKVPSCQSRPPWEICCGGSGWVRAQDVPPAQKTSVPCPEPLPSVQL